MDSQEKRFRVGDEASTVAVDWEAQAKQALSDLVVARDALQKLKAMLSSQIRMDSVSEKLARMQEELNKAKGDIASKDAQLVSLRVRLGSQDFALHRERMEQLIASQGVGLHVEHFMGELMRPPQLRLEFAEAYPESLELPPHVRFRPPFRIRVVGEDRRFFDKLAVLVHTVQDTIEITNALGGTLGASVKEDNVATFVDIKFITTSVACGGLPFRLVFTLCRDDANVVPIAGVETLLSGELHVLKQKKK